MMFPADGRHLGEALSAYLDDELAPAARREADVHLVACAGCREELQFVAEARMSVRALPVRPCPPAVWEGLLALPLGRRENRPGRRALWAVAAAAAAVLAALVPREPGVSPVLPALVESHATRASVTGDPLAQLAPIAVPVGFGP